ncbi:MAG: 3-oxoacyl-[acyl-carrier-protein] reductase [Alphaproteobacteria bacterium]|nr:3-oxoacyl-[acyl-carrier-protein] reductase [Alphaproteobacteria bacterium]MBL0718079.1 3-oxoacyl-[acyl-carrier-protein] reductase [Alphaproteobacteria bacterium]
MFNLENKNVLITGATGGIGASMVADFHKAGANVIACGRNIEKLKTIAGLYNERVDIVVADMKSVDSINDMVKTVLEKHNTIDVLINNAGMTDDGLAMRMDDNQWQSVIDINLTAPFQLTRAVMPAMMKQRTGRIINITSVVAFLGNFGQANYTASKGGLTSLTKTLASELGARNVTVNAIAPGFIETNMTKDLPDEVRKFMLSTIPLKSFGAVEDVSSTAVFLASDEARYITGQTIHVNGGMAKF